MYLPVQITVPFHLHGVSSARLFTKMTGMDLRKVSNENKLDLCRKYYIGGFALLPFLWFINSVWFFKEAFIKDEYEEQKQIRAYVVKSMIGTFVWTGILTAWIVVFQLNRVSWGVTADYISFIIPRGQE